MSENTMSTDDAHDHPASTEKNPSRRWGLGPASQWIGAHRLAWLVGVVLLFVVVDQTTKVWAQHNLTERRTVVQKVERDGEFIEQQVERFVPKRPPMVVIPGAFNFRYAENPAAAFSLTRSFPDWLRMPFLILFSSIAMVVVLLWYFRMAQLDGVLLLALSIIEAGAIGNFIDRVRLGYVIDFIDWHAGFINPAWPPWPTFNIADSCIVVGALLVVFRTLKPLYPPEEREAPAQADAA